MVGYFFFLYICLVLCLFLILILVCEVLVFLILGNFRCMGWFLVWLVFVKEIEVRMLKESLLLGWG